MPLFQPMPDRFDDLVGALEHVVVPESQDLEALRPQPCIPRFIVAGALVLAAVDLDDELSIQADEVDDVMTDRMLAAESGIADLLSSQTVPEPLLRVGHFVAKGPGALAEILH